MLFPAQDARRGEEGNAARVPPLRPTLQPCSPRSRGTASQSSSSSSTRSSGPPHCRHRPGPPVDQGQRRSLRFRLVPWACGTVIALLNLGSHIIAAPLVKLIERSECRNYYAEHDPTAIGPGGDMDESLCKISGIQARVAYLVGLISTISFVSGA
jgi:hypothetical protein